MKLLCYKLHHDAPPLVPASPTRDWMDQSSDRFAYRCLPLNIANAYGWEILSPATFEMVWDGKPEKEAIQIRALDGYQIERLAVSHFTRGIVTFHVGYMFRTPPGWDMLTTGPLNRPKNGIVGLSGIIETDWLPFPFTMNWQMTSPGTVVRFEKGEPFCTIIPIQHDMLESFRPTMALLDAEPELKAEYEVWQKSRADFLEKLDARDPETVRKSWQKFYMHGKKPTSDEKVETHKSKLRLRPVEDEGKE